MEESRELHSQACAEGIGSKVLTLHCSCLTTKYNCRGLTLPMTTKFISSVYKAYKYVEDLDTLRYNKLKYIPAMLILTSWINLRLFNLMGKPL